MGHFGTNNEKFNEPSLAQKVILFHENIFSNNFLKQPSFLDFIEK